MSTNQGIPSVAPAPENKGSSLNQSVNNQTPPPAQNTAAPKSDQETTSESKSNSENSNIGAPLSGDFEAINFFNGDSSLVLIRGQKDGKGDKDFISGVYATGKTVVEVSAAQKNEAIFKCVTSASDGYSLDWAACSALGAPKKEAEQVDSKNKDDKVTVKPIKAHLVASGENTFISSDSTLFKAAAKGNSVPECFSDKSFAACDAKNAAYWKTDTSNAFMLSNAEGSAVYFGTPSARYCASGHCILGQNFDADTKFGISTAVNGIQEVTIKGSFAGTEKSARFKFNDGKIEKTPVSCNDGKEESSNCKDFKDIKVSSVDPQQIVVVKGGKEITVASFEDAKGKLHILGNDYESTGNDHKIKVGKDNYTITTSATETTSSSSWAWWLLLIIPVVLLIVFIMFMMKKKKKSQFTPQ